MTRTLAGSTLLALIGVAAMQAQPPTPTRTRAAVKPSPTASKGALQGAAAPVGGSTAKPGEGNSPVLRDSTVASSPRDPASASQIVSDMSAQYDDLESAIESSYKKLTADQRGEIEELNAQIAAVNEQIRKLRAAQEKIKEVAAALESLEERQAAANLSKKITTLEAKAQRIKASLMTRTPVPTTKTPTRKG